MTYIIIYAIVCKEVKALGREKKNDRYLYPARITYSEKGVTISFPDIDCEVTYANERDAYLAARSVLGRRLFDLEFSNSDLPEPTPLSELSLEDGQKATLIDVYMPSVRMAGKYRSVNRMVTLPAWLNAAALERDINFSQVLQEALKKVIFDDIIE